MAQDMKVWRWNAKAELYAVLGNACADCGAELGDKPLEIAHVSPLTNDEAARRERIGSNRRLVMYRRQAEAGEVVLKCHPCNCADKENKPF